MNLIKLNLINIFASADYKLQISANQRQNASIFPKKYRKVANKVQGGKKSLPLAIIDEFNTFDLMEII